MATFRELTSPVLLEVVSFSNSHRKLCRAKVPPVNGAELVSSTLSGVLVMKSPSCSLLKLMAVKPVNSSWTVFVVLPSSSVNVIDVITVFPVGNSVA